MKENNTVYITLGTNLGDREENLKIALDGITAFGEITKKSSILETPPMGYEDQGDFLNMAIELKTNLSPIDLIIKFQEIEHKMGRTREFKNGPRIIDLDIILFNNEVIETDSLTIPHPGMQTRDFVLNPLSEIAPEVVHPILNKTINELKNGLK